ncbi:hypothetical protein [Pyruvatibacter sp.]
MGTKVTVWPKDLHTIRAMRDARLPVHAKCATCGLRLRVSYDLLIMKYGLHNDLVGKYEPCPRMGCHGQYVYYAKTGEGLPFRALVEHVA